MKAYIIWKSEGYYWEADHDILDNRVYLKRDDAMTRLKAWAVANEAVRAEASQVDAYRIESAPGKHPVYAALEEVEIV